ncbi:MAG: peptidoglycan-binding protein [Limnobacter sp.]|nr:peptidoglycan-binding protein [Limnobacter sp.]
MHDDQFTAMGPPFPSGFEKAAFSTEPTDTTQFQWGVRVLALRCGVAGQTRAGGVAGVYGDGRAAQFGVLGTAFGQRIGVVGASVDNNRDLFNLNVPPASVNLDSFGTGPGTGVFGKSGSGFGVHGMSSSSTAVIGTSRTGIGSHGGSDSSTGVLGTSGSGFGVHGVSNQGPAGVFESSMNAQLRLIPREMVSPEGQVAGSGGELLATVSAGVFRLWFCTRAGDAVSTVWDLVAGARPFPGAPLSENASGIDVKRIQMRLNMVFGTDLNGDGEFGPITRDAVVAFQEQQGIAQTGVVDAQTWDRLFALT